MRDHTLRGSATALPASPASPAPPTHARPLCNHTRWQMSYLPRPPPVNMLRVTGRPEHAAQRRPWGYGDDLDEAALPTSIKASNRQPSLVGLSLQL